MAFRDEVTFSGGIAYEGRTDEPERTEFSIQGVGKGEPGNPYALNLHLTTGNGTYCLCSILPNDMIRLGQWMIEIAKQKRREAAQETPEEKR